LRASGGQPRGRGDREDMDSLLQPPETEENHIIVSCGETADDRDSEEALLVLDKPRPI
jgi:hypothetical protein